ncbi:MAG: glycosyltransferase family 2 protein, partial [Chitinophagaceae bacterium]
YAGYGLVLLFLNTLRPKKAEVDEQNFPEITLLIPAYNEEEIIQQKVQNSLQLQYPAQKLFFVFITDGSTDDTPSIIGGYEKIKLLHQPIRNGKSAAINRAMKEVNTPIVVFTDANTMIHPDSLKKLVRHFADERIGGVSGEKRIVDNNHSAVGFGEKIYWQYESLLKKANARFYTLVGAAGELFAIRTSLFTSLDENIILDDFIISARICRQGYRFVYEEEAVAVETSSASMAEERKRKVRISAGCFQALFLLKDLLHPFKQTTVFFQYLSHRVLRWVACPLVVPLLFFSNAVLFFEETRPLLAFFFWAQVIFYFLALAGWMLSNKKIARFLLVPYYAVFMVFSQYIGFYRYIARKQTVLWEKAHRK